MAAGVRDLRLKFGDHTLHQAYGVHLLESIAAHAGLHAAEVEKSFDETLEACSLANESFVVDLTPLLSGDPAFRQQVDSIYATMTARPAGRTGAGHGLFPGSGISIQLPRVSPNLLAGLLEAVAGAPYDGHADLPAVAAPLQMEIDDLFPVAEALQFLRFADVAEGDIRLTDVYGHVVHEIIA